MGFLAMFLITVLLFNAVRAPLVIWATVPMAIVGVTVGLLVLNKPFGFMALLGDRQHPMATSQDVAGEGAMRVMPDEMMALLQCARAIP